jgi:hypothetical protein
MTSNFNSDRSSHPPSNDSEHPSVMHIMLEHQFTQTQALGRIEGKLDGHHRRITRLERAPQEPKFNPWNLLIAILPGVPGAVVLVLAALGKLPWSAAMTALTNGSGH